MADETFNFSDYWPKPTIAESIEQVGTNFDGTTFKSTFALDPNDTTTVWQDDYVDGEWRDRWVLKIKDGEVVEVADEYKADFYQFWTNRRVTAFADGSEIKWGGTQHLGDVIEEPAQISWWKSTFFTAPSLGLQRVEFYDQFNRFTVADGSAQYNDVLEVIYDQTWNGKTAGARMWFAKGIGIIQLSWRHESQDTEMVKSPMVFSFNKIPAITK